MPVKSASSHSFSAFASMLVATVISKYVWNHTPSFVEVSEFVGGLLVAVTGVEFSAELSGQILIATVLASLWGVLYHFSES